MRAGDEERKMKTTDWRAGNGEQEMENEGEEANTALTGIVE